MGCVGEALAGGCDWGGGGGAAPAPALEVAAALYLQFPVLGNQE